MIDLIAKLGTEVNFEDLEIQTVTLEGIDMRVTSPASLYKMKRKTVRPIDAADAFSLKEKFNLGEEYDAL